MAIQAPNFRQGMQSPVDRAFAMIQRQKAREEQDSGFNPLNMDNLMGLFKLFDQASGTFTETDPDPIAGNIDITSREDLNILNPGPPATQASPGNIWESF